MLKNAEKQVQQQVALHPEGVDRNTNASYSALLSKVALHPEGVDRNKTWSLKALLIVGRPPPGGRG